MVYNTARKKLALPEYGRNIQTMVDLAISLPTKEERNEAAYAIIAVMGSIFPHLRDINNYKHKLWDHLHIMADLKLDIDSPYEFPNIEELKTPPQRLKYRKTDEVKNKYLGRVTENMIREISTKPEEEQPELLKILVNVIKKKQLNGNRDTAAFNDNIIDVINSVAKDLKFNIKDINN